MGAAAAAAERVVIRPYPGSSQEQALASSADIVIFGGAAGCGKTRGLLLESLRHVATPGYRCVFFRWSTEQIRGPGQLWDESSKLYPLLGARGREQNLDWRFPSGAQIKFAYLQHEKDVHNWQGAQVDLFCFDELTHFTERQFWYVALSRGRSLSGIRPYVRATCNPDPDSFVARLIAWWIDQDTGLPIDERSGVVRWFYRIDEQLHWYDSKAEAMAAQPVLSEDGVEPKSLTFVRGRLEENTELLRVNPEYKSGLMALPRVERERLLGGNWKVRPTAGMYFQRGMFRSVKAAPGGLRSLRYWDLAATEPTPGTDPDWTVGARLCREAPLVYITDVQRMRGRPFQVEQLVRGTAERDGKGVHIWIEQEPGASGKAIVEHYKRLLPGFVVRGHAPTGDKIHYAEVLSAQADCGGGAGPGNVALVEAPWNEPFIVECENFPTGEHDDQVDAAAKGYDRLVSGQRWGAV